MIGYPATITGSGASHASSLAGTRFNLGTFSVSAAYSNFTAALESLREMSEEFPWPYDPIPFDTVDLMGLDGFRLYDPEPPDIEDIDVQLPPFPHTPPEMPAFQFDAVDIPTFDVVVPAFSIPDPPDVVWPTLDTEPPTPTDITIPTAPSITLPALPTLDGISVPSPPEITMPTFEGVAPSMDLTPPEPAFSWDEADYDSDLMQELKSKLLLDLQNGGSGLGAVIEQAIWDRALERQEVETEKTYNEALNMWSAKGHSLPQGALVSRLAEVRARIDQLNEDLNNDILIQESKLAQENTHFIIKAVVDWEKTYMTHLSGVQQRALEAAAKTVEMAIMIYGAKVEAYKAQLEAYKTYAQVFESRIRAEIAKVEIYKAQVEGIKVSVQIQAALIDAYKAQIAGIATLIDLYKAQMEGANIQAQYDATRIQAYKAVVEAYGIRVGAITSRYNAYQAQIGGEAEKANMYKTQVDAYSARIAASKVVADIDMTEMQLRVEHNKGEVQTYLGLIEKFKADIQRAIAEAEMIAKEMGYKTDVYTAEVGEFSAKADALSKVYTGRVSERVAEYDVRVKESEIYMKKSVALYELQVESMKAAAQVSAQICASAISSASASVHLGLSESRSDSRAGSAVNSESDSSVKYTEVKAGVKRFSDNVQHIFQGE